MGNIIKLDTPIIQKEEFKEAMDLLKEMPEEKANKIVAAINKLVLLEMIVSLGLEDVDRVNKEFGTSFDIEDEDDFILSDRIRTFFDLKNGGCYFCDRSIDPNGDFFNDRVFLCPDCQLKLANVLAYEGIDPLDKQYLPLVMRERKQKKREE
jgi:hypothetical protein